MTAKLLLFSLAAAFGGACLAPAQNAATAQPGVMHLTVAEFVSASRDGSRMAPLMKSALYDKLGTIKRISVYSSSAELEAVLGRLRRTSDGAFDPKTAPDLGKLVVGRHLLVGSIVRCTTARRSRVGKATPYEVNATVSFQLIDLETGKVELPVQETGRGRGYVGTMESVFGALGSYGRSIGNPEELLVDCVNQTVEKFIKKISGVVRIEGKVALNQTDLAVLDIGAQHGIAEGTVFEVMDVVEVDLPNGQKHRRETLVGHARVTRVGDDTCEVEFGKVNRGRFGRDDKIRTKIKVGMIVRTLGESK